MTRYRFEALTYGGKSERGIAEGESARAIRRFNNSEPFALQTGSHKMSNIFVVIDDQGMQRWYGEYPGMWLSPTELLSQAQTALKG